MQKRIPFSKIKQGKKVQGSARPGYMYTFRYEAKDDVYDMFPLIITLRIPINANYFVGLNLHYLRPDVRHFFLSNFIEKFGKGMGSEDFVMPRPALVDAYRSLRHWRYCIKKYNYDRLKSGLYIVPEEEWMTTSQLFYEKFIGIQYRQLWEDTKFLESS